ncbi:MAG: MarR family transcriptional regulator [Bacilli bacterium]|nr:MarR family transcriptional regulator [Bacilli bacterium]
MEGENNELLLANQLCFPLYAASKALVRRYDELLAPLGLTYTQYIVMLAMWELGEATVNQIGEMVCLDSGTLSPLLNKLTSKGFLEKKVGEDKRSRLIALTSEGEALREEARQARAKVACGLNLSEEEAKTLYRLCYKTLQGC